MNNSRTQLALVTSDSEKFGLTINLDYEPEYDKKNQEMDLKNWSNDLSTKTDDVELAIGCEETETTVNFFIKAEKRAKKVHNTEKRLTKFYKKFSFEGEPLRKPKSIEKSKTTENSKKESENSIKGNKNGKKESVQLQSKNCLKCNFETDSIGHLYEHMKTCNFSCSHCPFNTKCKLYLERHTKLHSSKNAAFKCTVCTFGSDSICTIKKHFVLHFGNSQQPELNKKIFKCPICASAAKSYMEAVSHFRRHAKKHRDLQNVIICPLCGMKTRKFSKHSRYHILKRDKKTRWKRKLSGEETDGQHIVSEDEKVDNDGKTKDTDSDIEISI